MITGEGTYKENAADANGVMQSNVERRAEVEVAFRWGTGYERTVECFTNTIRNVHGGTHRKGFERALVRALDRGDPQHPRAAAAQGGPAGPRRHARGHDRGHPRAGARSRSSPRRPRTSCPRPASPGSCRPWSRATSRSGSTAGAPRPRRAPSCRRWSTPPGSGSPRNSRRTRPAARPPSRAPRCRPSWSTAEPPASPQSELFIVEGDSALGTARMARSSEYQALLPIRGKILNVQKASLQQVLDNAECSAIVQVLGAGSGRTFDIVRAALRPRHDHGGRGRRRLAHPDSADHAVRQVHAPGDRGGPAVRRDAARCTRSPPRAATRRRSSPTPSQEMESTVARLERAGKTVHQAGPAVQGPRRDGRRRAVGHHHEPGDPHGAADHHGRRRGVPRKCWSCSWASGSSRGGTG